MSDDVVVAMPVSSGSGGMGMAVPQLTPQVKADLIDKIKPEAMVEIIRNRLLGREYDHSKKTWIEVPALKKRKLTEVGAWEIANLMLGVSSVNVSISKLKDREVKERLFRIAKSAQYMLVSNWREYGATTPAHFYYVHEIIFSNTLAVLKQADEASIQELLKGTVTEQRLYNNNPTSKESRGKRIGRMLGLTG